RPVGRLALGGVAAGQHRLQVLGEDAHDLLRDLLDDALAHGRGLAREHHAARDRAGGRRAVAGEGEGGGAFSGALARLLLALALVHRDVGGVVAGDELDLAAVLHRERTDLDLDDALVDRVRDLLGQFRAGNGTGDALDVHERGPDLVDRRLDGEAAFQIHQGVLLWGGLSSAIVRTRFSSSV